MLGVNIHINGTTIYSRTAVNMGTINDRGEVKYETDTGEIVWHVPADGAVVLAAKLLETIREQL